MIVSSIFSVGQQVLILFILISVGFVCAKTKLLQSGAIPGINNLLLYTVTPCVIIEWFHREYQPDMLLSLGYAALAAAAAHLINIAAASLLVRDKDKSREAVLRFGTVFSNCGYMALPLQDALRPDFRMSVNLSCRHLEQADLGRYAQDELKRLGLAPSNMMFELTESWPLLPGAPCQSGKAAAGRKEAAAGGAVVSSLKETGIRLAMDDFGSGYSSLLSLQKFPFDLVKIDREFVKGTARGGAQAAFVPSLTRLCHSVGCQVCLEGVETAEEYEAVRRLGIEVMQGYYFGRPVPAEEFERLYL